MLDTTAQDLLANIESFQRPTPSVIDIMWYLSDVEEKSPEVTQHQLVQQFEEQYQWLGDGRYRQWLEAESWCP